MENKASEIKQNLFIYCGQLLLASVCAFGPGPNSQIVFYIVFFACYL